MIRDGYQPKKRLKTPPPQGGSGMPLKHEPYLTVTGERYEELVRIEAAAKVLRSIWRSRVISADVLHDAMDVLVRAFGDSLPNISGSWMNKSKGDKRRGTKPDLNRYDNGK